MNSLMKSRSVLSRLGRLLIHRYKPTQPLLTPRYTTHIHTAARGSPSHVLDSIQGLLSRNVNRFIAYGTTPPRLPVTSGSQLPSSLRRWYRDPWKVAAAVLLPCATPFAVLGALSDNEIVPYTNRAHRVILSPSNERKFGDLAFEDIKKELGDKILDPADPRTVRVQHIAADIIRGVHRAFPTRSRSDCDDTRAVTDDMWVNESRKQGSATVQPQAGHLADLNWEVIVVKDDRFDAYCMAGGKIVVSTGLLDYFETDAEIATVLAHEVGHVVARHFSEFTQIARLVPALYQLLPFSRREEIEADLIGVMLMAASGFDPRAAAGVYETLADMRVDSAWDDYIGSHPSWKKRSRLLSRGKAIEEALELYYKQICAGESADRHFPYGGRIWETVV